MDETKDNQEIVIRTVGDGSTKIGDPTTKAGDPTQTKVTEARGAHSFLFSAFDQIITAPADAKQVSTRVDRSAMTTNSTDPQLLYMELLMSIDGGKTWGGILRTVQKDKDGKDYFLDYPLQAGMFTGGFPAGTVFPQGMSDAIHGMTLPPDVGSGRLARSRIGAKEPVDIGIKITFD